MRFSTSMTTSVSSRWSVIVLITLLENLRVSLSTLVMDPLGCLFRSRPIWIVFCRQDLRSVPDLAQDFELPLASHLLLDSLFYKVATPSLADELINRFHQRTWQ